VTQEHLAQNGAEEVARGRAALGAAEKLLAADLPYDAASRAYYAAFHFARALAWAAGEEPRTHKGVAHFLHQHYVEPGKLPPDTDRLYNALQNFREKSDYSTDFLLDHDGAAEAVANAGTLVERMGVLLRALGVA
jgi:uncharacterized protein (UPF0332 family)